MIDSQTIKFAKAKGGYVDQVPEWMLTDPAWVLERKYDGCRYRMIIEDDGTIILQSRKVSTKTGKFVEKQDRVPHLTGKKLEAWAGTIVEGEIVVEKNSCTSSSVVSIMGCDAEKAIARQEETGKLHWVMFDILFFCGKDYREWPEANRRRLLDDFRYDVSRMRRDLGKYLSLSERISPDQHSHMETYESFIEKGYEGGMLKDTNAVYGKGWWKMKPVVEIDAIVTGFTEGKGKFAGQIGAIEFSVIDSGGALRYLGKASGMDDAVRNEISKNRDKFFRRLLEIKCQEVCRKKDWYSLRHPRFSRWRDDLPILDITAEKLEREIK
jgi:ATP-dependent DNA ligase